MTDADETPREFDKVDRALEMQVIDWLQYAEFSDDIRRGYGDADKAELALQLIAKRKAAYLRVKEERDALTARVAELEAALALKAKAHIK